MASWPSANYEAFLEQEKKVQQFKKNRENILKLRLKKLQQIRKQAKRPGHKKGFSTHKIKQLLFEFSRLNAFSDYKAKHIKYQNRQKQILKARLEQLKNIRQKEKSQKIKEKLF